MISREFQIFAKPVGSSCNLNCSYCYYRGNKDFNPRNRNPGMSEYVLEKYIIQHIEASTDQDIMFSWHGGEPLLAGRDFYTKVVTLQKKHQPPGCSILNGVQTNGTLLDEEWCSFFASEGFIAGISIDGPGDLHNRNRHSLTEDSSLTQVLRGYELLKKYGISTEILCVVGAHNVNYPLIVYDFFKQLEVKYVTFLPLVIRQAGSASGVSTNSVPSEAWGSFLCAVFDEWVKKDIGKIKIQIFEEAARTAFNQKHTLCIFKVDCGRVPVIEHNGDFYSCDHFVDKDHLIGNISKRSLADLLDSPEQIAFGKAKSLSLPHLCLDCDVRNMCNGECPKNRFIDSPDGKPELNYLCSGYKQFFTHCRPFVEAIKLASGIIK